MRRGRSKLPKPVFLFINLLYITSLKIYKTKKLQFINLRKLTKPTVLFIGTLLIISMISCLAAAAVQTAALSPELRPSSTPVSTTIPIRSLTSKPTLVPTPFPISTSDPVPATTPASGPIPIPISTATSDPNPAATPNPVSTSDPNPAATSSPIPTSDLTPAATPISTPTPTITSTPTPIPAPTATPNPTSASTSSGLPLSCIGDDYLVFANFNGDPSFWNYETHYFTEFHCNTARLGISFADEPVKTCSTYDKAKLASVLAILNSVGVKVILVDQNGNPEAWYGSQAWINDWRQVASDFAGDTRIKAFEIAGECYSGYWSTSIYGAYNMHDFDLANAACIDAIRSVDWSRTIVYPLVDVIFTDSASAFYNDLVATGVTAKGNIIYDVIHAYYFENSLDLGMSPSAKADWYWSNYIQPQINYFGVQNCWCGETYCWPGTEHVDNNPANPLYSEALQQQFDVAMINHFVAAGMGFQMWCFFSSSEQQAQIDTLTSSNYWSSS